MLVKIPSFSTLISVVSCYLLCMLAIYVFTVSSRVWVRKVVQILRGPRFCYVVLVPCYADMLVCFKINIDRI